MVVGGTLLLAPQRPSVKPTRVHSQPDWLRELLKGVASRGYDGEGGGGGARVGAAVESDALLSVTRMAVAGSSAAASAAGKPPPPRGSGSGRRGGDRPGTARAEAGEVTEWFDGAGRGLSDKEIEERVAVETVRVGLFERMERLREIKALEDLERERAEAERLRLEVSERVKTRREAEDRSALKKFEMEERLALEKEKKGLSRFRLEVSQVPLSPRPASASTFGPRGRRAFRPPSATHKDKVFSSFESVSPALRERPVSAPAGGRRVAPGGPGPRESGEPKGRGRRRAARAGARGPESGPAQPQPAPAAPVPPELPAGGVLANPPAGGGPHPFVPFLPPNSSRPVAVGMSAGARVPGPQSGAQPQPLQPRPQSPGSLLALSEQHGSSGNLLSSVMRAAEEAAAAATLAKRRAAEEAAKGSAAEQLARKKRTFKMYARWLARFTTSHWAPDRKVPELPSELHFGAFGAARVFHLQKVFEALDTERRGKVPARVLALNATRFADLDRELKRATARAGRTNLQVLEAMDADGDGCVTLAELIDGFCRHDMEAEDHEARGAEAALTESEDGSDASGGEDPGGGGEGGDDEAAAPWGGRRALARLERAVKASVSRLRPQSAPTRNNVHYITGMYEALSGEPSMPPGWATAGGATAAATPRQARPQPPRSAFVRRTLDADRSVAGTRPDEIFTEIIQEKSRARTPVLLVDDDEEVRRSIFS